MAQTYSIILEVQESYYVPVIFFLSVKSDLIYLNALELLFKFSRVTN